MSIATSPDGEYGKESLDTFAMRRSNALIMLQKAFVMGVFDENDVVIQPFTITTHDGDTNTILRGCSLEVLLKLLIERHNSDEIITMEVHTDEESGANFRDALSALSAEYMSPSEKKSHRIHEVNEIPEDSVEQTKILVTGFHEEMDVLFSHTPLPLASEPQFRYKSSAESQ